MTGAPSPERPPTWPMYRALVGIGIVCGLLIVGVYELTRPIIAANRAAALREAIFEVLPAARSSQAFVWTEQGGFAVADDDSPASALVYAGYDDADQLVGIAVEARGMGYQDVITVLYGYAPQGDVIVGMQVLDSRETPGLGDKIAKDEAFLANFAELDVRLNGDGSALEHPIEATKHGDKQHAWQVDAITGATISSVAIADLLRKSATLWMPRIRPRVSTFAARAGEGR